MGLAISLVAVIVAVALIFLGPTVSTIYQPECSAPSFVLPSGEICEGI